MSTIISNLIIFRTFRTLFNLYRRDRMSSISSKQFWTLMMQMNFNILLWNLYMKFLHVLYENLDFAADVLTIILNLIIFRTLLTLFNLYRRDRMSSISISYGVKAYSIGVLVWLVFLSLTPFLSSFIVEIHKLACNGK